MSKFTFQHTYKYPWELVTHTHLTKYPTEKEKNIVGIECIESRRGKLKSSLKFNWSPINEYQF